MGDEEEDEEEVPTGPGRRKRKKTAKGLGLDIGKDGDRFEESENEREDGENEENGIKYRKSGRKRRIVDYSIMNSKKSALLQASEMEMTTESNSNNADEEEPNDGQLVDSPYIDNIEDEDIYRGGTKIGRSLIPADVNKFLQNTGNGPEYNELSDLLMARIRPYPPHSTMEGNSYNESYDIYDELS